MMEESNKITKTRVSVTLTKVYTDALDKLVEVGVFVDRREVVTAGLRRVFRHYKMKPFSPEGEAEALGAESLSQEKLVERIDVLRESEDALRAERQSLEKQLRYMVNEHLLNRGAEG